MSIIQTIRDRAAILVFVIIALSLIGFLVQDAFVGGGNSFMNQATSTVGTVNGKEVTRQEYDARVNAMESQYQSQGYPMGESMRQNIYEQAWNGFVTTRLLEEQAEKLGIQFTQKELGALLLSDDAPMQFKREFTDPQTGVYDISKVREFIRSFQRSKNAEQVKLVNEQVLEPIRLGELRNKFASIFTGAVYVPKWLIEKQQAENSQVADISFVAVAYSTVADSLAKVSDQEIRDYIDEHKNLFKQKRSRSIAFVVFNGAATAADSAAIVSRLNNLKAEFGAAPNPGAFATRNATKTPFQDVYMSLEQLPAALKDSNVQLTPGTIVGPNLENNTYSLARVIDIKTLPDSARARHILIGTVNPQTGQPLLEDSVAKKRIDSIKTAIDGGASFELLAMQYSDDQSSKVKGGDLGFFGRNAMVKTFNDFSFEKPKGSRDVVKSEFGYHLIEVLDQKNFNPAYKVAFITKEIVPSEETDNTASSAATQFAANSRTAKAFQDNARRQNLNVRVADEISEMTFDVPGVGPSRALAKWVYENKIGSVSDPFSVGDQYIVASITQEREEGMQSVATARPFVESEIRNRKKSELLRAKFGKYASIDELAGKLTQAVQRADSVKFSDNFHPAFANENKIIGAAFNKNYKGKVSAPIAGLTGVYAIQVNNTGALSNLNSSLDLQRLAQTAEMRRQTGFSLFQALQESANIKDKRIEAGY